MTNPADELRAAADKLRTLATTAADRSGGTTWRFKRRFPDQPDFDYGTLAALDKTPFVRGGGRTPASLSALVGDYIAAMGPSVGLALADWLKESAVVHLPETECGFCDPTRNPKRLSCPALAVARQINRTA